MSRAPLISIAFVIAGDGFVEVLLRYHFLTTAAAPVTTGAAKLVPADITYVTPSIGGTTDELHRTAQLGLPSRDAGSVTRVDGATRSGLIMLLGSRTAE